MDYEQEADSAPAEATPESETPGEAGQASEMAASEPATDATYAAHDAGHDADDAGQDAAADANDAVADAHAGLDADAEQITAQAEHVFDSAPAAHDYATSTDSMPDLGSDADVMDDSFASSLRPPEWPAADLVPADFAADGGPTDMGDDSDAPVLDDAAEATAPADHVNLSSGVSSISAGTVTLSQGGAGQVHADEMHVSQSGVGLARVNNLTLGDGASAFAVVADQATVEEGSNTFLVVSRSVNGEVRSTVDWRAAMAFGAGLGLVVSILRRLR